MDHSAYLSFVNRNVPVNCGDTTRTILEAQSKMRRSDLEFSIKGFSLKPFRTNCKVKIGSVEIKPMHIDHSVLGGDGFIIRTTSGAVV